MLSVHSVTSITFDFLLNPHYFETGMNDPDVLISLIDTESSQSPKIKCMISRIFAPALYLRKNVSFSWFIL